MSIRNELKSISHESREFRKFGLLIGGLLMIGGAIASDVFFIYPGVAILLGGLIYPRCLRYLYVVWMGAGILMGWFVSQAVLSALYFVVVTPLAVIGRLMGKDFLAHRIDRSAESYWIKRKRRERAECERQF
jgi:hypothetical protein